MYAWGQQPASASAFTLFFGELQSEFDNGQHNLQAVLSVLNLADNTLCGIDADGHGTYDASGIQALATAIGSGSAVLNRLDVRYNGRLDDASKQALQDAVSSREGFSLLL